MTLGIRAGLSCPKDCSSRRSIFFSRISTALNVTKRGFHYNPNAKPRFLKNQAIDRMSIKNSKL
jgi:hypothetical protein